MERLRINTLYDLSETMAAELLSRYTYPWEVLPFIHDFILKLGETLPEELYEKRGDNVWLSLIHI